MGNTHLLKNSPLKIVQSTNCTNTRSKTTTCSLEITLLSQLLDRFEILYGDKVTNLRRFYNDGHLLDLLRITGKEDLRRFVEEKITLVCLDILKIKALTILKILENYT